MVETSLATPAEGICDVYIVRHGERLDEVRGAEQEDWRASLKGADSFDPPLTEKGKLQALASARSLRSKFSSDEIAFDVVHCSPLQRCVSTAQAFSHVFGIPIQLVDGLGECCASLRHYNAKAPIRWPLLKSRQELEALCRNATFIEKDPIRDMFIDPRSGRTCLGRLARGKVRILAVSHRESIRNLGKLTSKSTEAQFTPYACVALFAHNSCASDDNDCERWAFKGFMQSPASAAQVKGAREDDPAAAELRRVRRGDAPKAVVGPKRGRNSVARSNSASKGQGAPIVETSEDQILSMVSAHDSLSLRSGIPVVAGNAKHSSGSTALRLEAYDKSKCTGVSIRDGTVVLVLELGGHGAWAKISAGRDRVGWLKTRNVHWQWPKGVEKAKVPTPARAGGFVLRPGRDAVVGNILRESGLTALRRRSAPEKGENLTGNAVANGDVVTVLEVSSGDWVNVRSLAGTPSGDGCECVVGSDRTSSPIRSASDSRQEAIGWIRARNLHVQL